MFSVHTTSEIFEKATINGHFGFVFEGNLGREFEITRLDFRRSSAGSFPEQRLEIEPRKSRDYRDIIVFAKLRFQNVFRPHKNAKLAFSKSSGMMKSVFEKLRFREGLVRRGPK